MNAATLPDLRLHEQTRHGFEARKKMRTGAPLTQCRGFMLMEVLAAVIILTVVMVALTQSTIQSMNSASEMKDYTRAIMLAQHKMWELENEFSFTQKGSTSQDGTYLEPFDGYSWEADIKAEEGRLVFVVSLRIQWSFRQKDRWFNLTTEVPMRGDEVDRRRDRR